ncbi:hypothetical protein RIB2604_00802320 [Aspergillus luchuensis]|uniref:Uncharacterized protein n=1 Tax=Aspergillus kawachii TaxID=1069201 RepID=A0A146F4M1_ASPKA|nr:hypothetical protein RIB2604_00802320 [Aspergillus luchuensis]
MSFSTVLSVPAAVPAVLAVPNAPALAVGLAAVGPAAAGIGAAGVGAAGVDTAGVDTAGVDAAGVDAAGLDDGGLGNADPGPDTAGGAAVTIISLMPFNVSECRVLTR